MLDEEDKKNLADRFKEEIIAEIKQSDDTLEKKGVKLQFLELTAGRFKDLAKGTEILVFYILSKIKVFTTKDDNKSEVWVYKDGIYVPQGKSEIKEILRGVLEEQYNSFIYNAVMNKIEPDTYVDAQKFFSISYPYEVVVENGILNAKTLDLKPWNPDKIFFNKLPVKYDPDATCPKINQFLKDVVAKEDDIKIIYEIGGFGLIKIYLFEKAFMFLGNGRNGKDKTFELYKRLFGIENCCSISLNSLTDEGFSISELFGKMFNLAGDISNKDLKDTNMFKACTGRSLLGGNRKFLNKIHFENHAKFVFACNDLPMVYDTSKGFWDRWVLIDFPYTFVTKEEYEATEDKTMLKIRDEDIIQKIVTPDEMSGFLNECLVGLHRILEYRHFSTTSGSEEVKTNWIRKSNSFMAFCLDYVEGNYECKIRKRDLRKRYSDYCKKHKLNGKSDIVIKITLQEMFGAIDERIQTQELNINDWFWVGVKWK